MLGCESMNQIPTKIYWHADTSSGGTLSLDLDFEGNLSKAEKEKHLAGALEQCVSLMSKNGHIPFSARLLSSSDIAEEYGNTRQYWEKLLNEGKILYKETSAGRITTDLWVTGYLRNREEVNGYVRNIKKILKSINESPGQSGAIDCMQCGESNFQYHKNTGGHINGCCRSCNFYVYTINE